MRSYLDHGVLAVAAVLTLTNAFKPPTVDDTAYLHVAEQVAAHPTDPYGFTQHWYQHPKPALLTLAPPVLPYWLAAGVAVFGMNVFWLKLTLFPFAWVFAGAVHALMLRFAAGNERRLMLLVCLSPLVWPGFNLMLDLPAHGLALAGLDRFLVACDAPDRRGRLRLAALAGLIGGVAMQTKYTAFTLPLAIAGIGAVRGRIGLAAVACGCAAAVFAAWEGFLGLRYGASHFLETTLGPGERMERNPVLLGLICQFGTTLPALLMAAGTALKPSRAVGVAVGVGVAYFVVLLGFLGNPDSVSVILYGFGGLGVTLLAAAVAFLVRGYVRRDSDRAVLTCWLVAEVIGYFLLNPFIAARRIMGLAFAVAAVVGWGVRGRAIPNAVVAVGVVLGACFAWVDYLGAEADQDGVALADRFIREQHPNPRIWFVGHWGWQFHAERAGWTAVVPDESQLNAGDWIVIPDGGTHYEQQKLASEAGNVVLVDALAVGGDGAPFATFPSFYGGIQPLHPHHPPRLRMLVLWVTSTHVPKTPPGVR